jgi:hypothetical protein
VLLLLLLLLLLLSLPPLLLLLLLARAAAFRRVELIALFLRPFGHPVRNFVVFGPIWTSGAQLRCFWQHTAQLLPFFF